MSSPGSNGSSQRNSCRCNFLCQWSLEWGDGLCRRYRFKVLCSRGATLQSWHRLVRETCVASCCFALIWSSIKGSVDCTVCYCDLYHVLEGICEYDNCVSFLIFSVLQQCSAFFNQLLISQKSCAKIVCIIQIVCYGMKCWWLSQSFIEDCSCLCLGYIKLRVDFSILLCSMVVCFT